MSETRYDDSIVIIGNGIAGVSAAEAARKNNKEVRITIISDENYPAYYRLRLCELITNEQEYSNELILHDDQWYSDRNIEVILGKRVIKIYPDEKSIQLNTGENIKYCKLIIASGSSSRIPEVPGNDKSGVYGFRTLDDIKKIKEKLKNASEVVILGGGLLGLEAAYNLNRKGLNVSIVELSQFLLPKQLDRKASLLFEKKVRSLGINLYCGLSARAIEGGASVEKVILDNGYSIKTDFVLYSAGVMSNTGFAGYSGIDVGRGIVVDQRMMTQNPDIYACGDVAEFQRCMPGQWSVAMNQGRVAGINASGGEAEYSCSIMPYFLNTMGIKIYSIEDVGKNGGVYDTLEYSDEGNYIYQKLFFLNECCVGGILMGDIESFNRINTAIKKRLSKKEVIEQKLIKQ